MESDPRHGTCPNCIQWQRAERNSLFPAISQCDKNCDRYPQTAAYFGRLMSANWTYVGDPQFPFNNPSYVEQGLAARDTSCIAAGVQHNMNVRLAMVESAGSYLNEKNECISGGWNEDVAQGVVYGRVTKVNEESDSAKDTEMQKQGMADSVQNAQRKIQVSLEWKRFYEAFGPGILLIDPLHFESDVGWGKPSASDIWFMGSEEPICMLISAIPDLKKTCEGLKEVPGLIQCLHGMEDGVVRRCLVKHIEQYIDATFGTENDSRRSSSISHQSAFVRDIGDNFDHDEDESMPDAESSQNASAASA